MFFCSWKLGLSISLDFTRNFSILIILFYPSYSSLSLATKGELINLVFYRALVSDLLLSLHRWSVPNLWFSVRKTRMLCKISTRNYLSSAIPSCSNSLSTILFRLRSSVGCVERGHEESTVHHLCSHGRVERGPHVLFISSWNLP